MKATGMTRKVDGLGRIVIPIELKRTMGIKENDTLEIYTDGNRIAMQKYQPGCMICNSMDGLVNQGNVCICQDCIKQLQKQAKLNQEVSKRR